MTLTFFRFIVFICISMVSFRMLFATSQTPFFWGIALEGYPIKAEMLEQAERDTQLHSQIVVFFLQWPSSPEKTGFPKDSLDVIWNSGAVPCITWEPMYYENGKEIMIPYQQILKGDYDLYIKLFAEEAKLWGKPFLIRFAHEMNIVRYHWGTDKADYGPRSPEIYKQLFRHVVSLFKKTGADNVLWTFCPNAESVPNTSYDSTASWNQACNYYPGDDYVDILGMDGYNWGTTQTLGKHGWDSRWKSFKEIFSTLYKDLKTLSPQKPLFIFETSTANKGGQKKIWIREAIATLDEWEVQGIVWFQAVKEQDWRINADGNSDYIPIFRSKTSGSQHWFKILKSKKN